MASRLPDFIIVGAMKSGTSSIHSILESHPRVFIPAREIYFFDIDDIDQHPDFFVRTAEGWTDHDFDRDLETYLEWYRSFFEQASDDQLLGEDSASYLSSAIAPRRIARMLPDVKLIAILRDPVARAYSHYWHLVSTGRATLPFDEQIQRSPENILTRGFYKDQLERYRRHFPPYRLRVLMFEEFVKDTQKAADSLFGYLGLPSIDVSSADQHRNAARPPLSLGARLLWNRTFPRLSKSYTRRLPNMPGYSRDSLYNRLEPLGRRISEAYDSIRSRRRYPPMDPSTRAFLEKVYRRANAGLSDLIGRDVSEHWEYMRP